MLASLLAYDADGNVIATLDSLVACDDAGDVVGLIDFAAHEAAGGKLRDVWNVAGAKGSGTWPEWLGARHDFTVELDKGKRIAALVHKKSGHRRERATIEAQIADRIKAADGQPADIRDLVGGPGRPLVLDTDGKTTPWTPPKRLASLLVPSARAHLDEDGRTAERLPMGTPGRPPLIGG
jgi:hypothetical protein